MFTAGDDSETNVFVLGQLDSLVWRKYVFKPLTESYCITSRHIYNSLNDPALQVYEALINKNVPCTWRFSGEAGDFYLKDLEEILKHSRTKELYVFSFSKEVVPLDESDFIIDSSSGQFDGSEDNEYLDLLIAAVENVFERLLCKNSYVKLGAFYVYTSPDYKNSEKEHPLPSLTFSYFIYYGCLCVHAIVDFKKLRVPSKKDITKVLPAEQEKTDSVRPLVYLAPFGFPARLLRAVPSVKAQDDLLELWLKRFPLEALKTKSRAPLNSCDLPGMVWVLIEKSGIRMRYPTALTFHMSYAPTQPSTAHSLAEAAFSQVWIRFIQKEFTAPQKLVFQNLKLCENSKSNSKETSSFSSESPCNVTTGTPDGKPAPHHVAPLRMLHKKAEIVRENDICDITLEDFSFFDDPPSSRKRKPSELGHAAAVCEDFGDTANSPQASRKLTKKAAFDDPLKRHKLSNNIILGLHEKKTRHVLLHDKKTIIPVAYAPVPLKLDCFTELGVEVRRKESLKERRRYDRHMRQTKCQARKRKYRCNAWKICSIVDVKQDTCRRIACPVRLKKTMGFPFPLDKGASLPAPSRRVFFPCVSIAPLFQRGERAATTSETSTQKISTVDSFIAYALLSFLPTAAYLSLQKKTCSEETSFCSSSKSSDTLNVIKSSNCCSSSCNTKNCQACLASTALQYFSDTALESLADWGVLENDFELLFVSENASRAYWKAQHRFTFQLLSHLTAFKETGDKLGTPLELPSDSPWIDAEPFLSVPCVSTVISDSLKQLKKLFEENSVFLRPRGPLTIRELAALSNSPETDTCFVDKLSDSPSFTKNGEESEEKVQETLVQPLSVPSVVVGYEDDWISVSPFALALWEKLSLEPFSAGKAVEYVALAPATPLIASRLRLFLKELSSVYETLRLGTHVPLESPLLRDGVYLAGHDAQPPQPRVQYSKAFSLSNFAGKEELERYYTACVCIGKMLSSKISGKPNAESARVAALLPHYVIYLVDPLESECSQFDFSFCMAALRSCLPKFLGPRLTLQVLSVANLLEPGLGKGALASPVSLVDCAKSIAFSVFSKMRVLVHSKIPLPKSPVDLFPQSSVELYGPAFVLSTSQPDSVVCSTGALLRSFEGEIGLLHCSYTLSDDWLLCVWADATGELLRPRSYLLSASNSTSKKEGVAVSIIMNSARTIIAETAMPWRIVVVKVDSFTSVELEEWKHFCGEKPLELINTEFFEECKVCSRVPWYERPAILSLSVLSLSIDKQMQFLLPLPPSTTFEGIRGSQNDHLATFAVEDLLSKSTCIAFPHALIPLETYKLRMDPLTTCYLATTPTPSMQLHPAKVTCTRPSPFLLSLRSLVLVKLDMVAHHSLLVEPASPTLRIYHEASTRSSCMDTSSNYAAALKFVAEEYNRMSWHTFTPLSQERRSCLPHHICILTRLISQFKNNFTSPLVLHLFSQLSS